MSVFFTFGREDDTSTKIAESPSKITTSVDIIFALRFPDDNVRGWRVRVDRIAFAAAIGAEGVLIANELREYPKTLHGSFGGESVMAYFSAASLLIAAAILIARYREVAGRMHMQIRLALFGMVLGLCYLVYAMFLIAVRVRVAGYQTAFGLWAGFGAAAIAIIPACTAYALVRAIPAPPRRIAVSGFK